MAVKEYKRILIIKMSSLGDIISALPTLYAVRKNWPNATITWAVHDQFSSILPGTPWIDDVVYIDRKGLKSFSYLKKLRRELHEKQFDVCIDLQCIAKSAIVAFLSGAKEKYGYWELREGSFLVNKPLVGDHKYGHVIERYLDTVRCLGGTVDAIEFPLPVYEEAAKQVESVLKKDNLSFKDEYILMAPGARWLVKEWPLPQWADLIERCVTSKKHVILIGSVDDSEKGHYIESHLKNTLGEEDIQAYFFNYIGKTNLHELVELIRHTSLFISGDTGPLHIANALKVSIIALFGVTSPVRSGPYGGDHYTVVESPTSQVSIEQLHVNDPDCMKQITVDEVFHQVERMLANKKHKTI